MYMYMQLLYKEPYQGCMGVAIGLFINSFCTMSTAVLCSLLGTFDKEKEQTITPISLGVVYYRVYLSTQFETCLVKFNIPSELKSTVSELQTTGSGLAICLHKH